MTTIRQDIYSYIRNEVSVLYNSPETEFLTALRQCISNILCSEEGKPVALKESSTLAIDTIRLRTDKPIPGEFIIANEASPDNRILYVHGGGLVAGSSSTHAPLVSRLAKATGMTVFTLDYPLAPEYPYPAALESVVEAANWLMEHTYNAEVHGVSRSKAKNIFLMGDSAGAGLILAAAMQCYEALQQPIDGIVAICALTDFSASSESLVTNSDKDPLINPDIVSVLATLYAPGERPDSPQISPLFANYSRLPPTLLQVSDSEALLDDSVRFHYQAQAHQRQVHLRIYEGLPHVWHSFAPVLSEANIAIKEIQHFLNKLKKG